MKTRLSGSLSVRLHAQASGATAVWSWTKLINWTIVSVPVYTPNVSPNLLL